MLDTCVSVVSVCGIKSDLRVCEDEELMMQSCDRINYWSIPPWHHRQCHSLTHCQSVIMWFMSQHAQFESGGDTMISGSKVNATHTHNSWQEVMGCYCPLLVFHFQHLMNINFMSQITRNNESSTFTSSLWPPDWSLWPHTHTNAHIPLPPLSHLCVHHVFVPVPSVCVQRAVVLRDSVLQEDRLLLWKENDSLSKNSWGLQRNVYFFLCYVF